MQTVALLASGVFLGSMVYQSIRDYRFYKRHRITTPEQDREVRSFAFTPVTNIIDALMITAIILALYMVFQQHSG